MSAFYEPSKGALDRIIRFCLENRLIVFLLLLVVLAWGASVAPFALLPEAWRNDPVPVDAIPDYGENQQVIFTEWMGRSPQDVEDQVTYPLSTALLGVPGVRSIRATSMFGMSFVTVIFNDNVEFYWSRARLLEKLSSLPSGLLPDGVSPQLGPDATGLGQVYWYTLESRDPHGHPVGGWDPDELRSVQDWFVRYSLMSVEGVSEVASIGGFTREWQVDVDPDAMRAHGVTLMQIANAVRGSNLDVGARNLEINRVEYYLRGLGLLKDLSDLEQAVVTVRDNVPITIGDVAKVQFGPGQRLGALDRGGLDAVGGVVVVRYGENPLEVIDRVRARVNDIAPALPARALIDWERVTPNEVSRFTSAHAIAEDGLLDWMNRTDNADWPEWLTRAQVEIVPFYDRTELIHETLDTLGEALRHQILITILVVLLMVRHFGASGLISAMLPMAVLIAFIAMKQFGVDANIVALSGIAIAIGVMVDMGIVLCENTLRLRQQEPDAGRLDLARRAALEVGGAVLTAATTTVISFLPVFFMTGAEGKLFQPLAFTKVFALVAAILLALTVLPALSTKVLLGKTARVPLWLRRVFYWVILVAVWIWLTADWRPLGMGVHIFPQLLLVGLLLFGSIGLIALFHKLYPKLLRVALNHRKLFLPLPAALMVLALFIWLGAPRLLGWMPSGMRSWRPVSAVLHAFPGLGREFMPRLDEGSFLFMPVTSDHASIGEARDLMQIQGQLIDAVPEVDEIIGKLGRVESPLDPAPIAMFESVIHYYPEYLRDERGRVQRFRFDRRDTDFVRDVEGNKLPAPDGEPYQVRGRFIRDDDGQLVPDRRGMPFRLWRPALDPDLNEDREAWAGIRTPQDIWNALERAARVPGVTPASILQPIETRLVMLQTGIRANFAMQIQGTDLHTMDRAARELETLLRRVPAVNADTVAYEPAIGKPYLEIEIDRAAIARYGLSVTDVQMVLETAIGGQPLGQTTEGRERYPIRVRYPRELRETPEDLENVLVSTMMGVHVPLGEMATIHYRPGPQMIRTEDTFLTTYVTFDRAAGVSQLEAVEQARAFLESEGWQPPAGVRTRFTGVWENQVRAARTLSWVLPLSLLLILVILHLQFHRLGTSLMVFSGVFTAWSGGFLLLWFYGFDGFLDFSLFGQNLRELFQVHPVNLSVAVWVGFLALFGIATDDGVLFATRLDQTFEEQNPKTKDEIREAVVDAASKRIRPALMTTATTLLALLPVMTSTGKGSDIMVPMALPAFGGMIVATLTVFVVPVLYAWRAERGNGKM